MKKIAFLMLVGGVFAIACESKTYEEISKPVSNPTYVANVKQVISANCLSCHGAGQSPKLGTYEEVKAASQNGNLLCKINGNCGVMPPNQKMPQVTVDMINLWAQQGYVNQ